MRYTRMTSGLGRYRNPYGRPLKKKPRTGLFLWLLTIGGGLILGIYLLIFSPAFSILDVTVSGATPEHAEKIRDIARQYLDEKIFYIIPKRNTFFAVGDELEDRINSAIFLESLRLKREGQHLLKIEIVEKEPTVVVVSARKAFLTDKSGLVLSELEPAAADLVSRMTLSTYLTSTSSISFATGTIYTAPRLPASTATDSDRYPALFIAYEAQYIPRQQSGQPEAFQTIFKSRDALKEFGIELLAAAISSDKSKEMSIRTNEGWDIYLFSGDQLDSELEILKTTLKNTLRERRDLQYVDLRYGNKVFYK